MSRGGRWRSVARTLRVAPSSWAIAFGFLGFFIYYSIYRVRFIGGCDSAAYFIEAERLLGHATGLARDPAIGFPNAQVPLCMVDTDGVIHSFFPPGFSVLLAAFIGVTKSLAFFVTPLFGVLGGVALYAHVSSITTRWRAAFVTAIWLLAPLTFWGSTQVMSDVVAASVVLIAVVAANRSRGVLAGLVLGFSLGIRPACLLALPAILLFAPTWRARGAILLGIFVAALGWALFVYREFGHLTFPYANNLQILDRNVFGGQLVFLLREVLRQYAPLVALGAIGVASSPRRSLPYLVWFLPFLLLGSLWGFRYDAWWATRQLATALPALAGLAALGMERVRSWEGTSRTTLAGGVMTLAAYALWSVFAFPQIHDREFDSRYEENARLVASHVPPGSFVSALNSSATLRYYTNVASINSCNYEIPDLAIWAAGAGRPMFMILGLTEGQCIGTYLELRKHFDLERSIPIPICNDLYRLRPARVLSFVDGIGPLATELSFAAPAGDYDRDGTTTIVIALGPSASPDERALSLTIDVDGQAVSVEQDEFACGRRARDLFENDAQVVRVVALVHEGSQVRLRTSATTRPVLWASFRPGPR